MDADKNGNLQQGCPFNGRVLPTAGGMGQIGQLTLGVERHPDSLSPPQRESVQLDYPPAPKGILAAHVMADLRQGSIDINLPMGFVKQRFPPGAPGS